eukprot:452809-Pleurochrysis_carterae.AAC.1
MRRGLRGEVVAVAEAVRVELAAHARHGADARGARHGPFGADDGDNNGDDNGNEVPRAHAVACDGGSGSACGGHGGRRDGDDDTGGACGHGGRDGHCMTSCSYRTDGSGLSNDEIAVAGADMSMPGALLASTSEASLQNRWSDGQATASQEGVMAKEVSGASRRERDGAQERAKARGGEKLKEEEEEE